MVAITELNVSSVILSRRTEYSNSKPNFVFSFNNMLLNICAIASRIVDFPEPFVPIKTEIYFLKSYGNSIVKSFNF